MTAPSPFSRSQPVQPSVPKGDVLGTYDTYPEAQSVVDRLAKAEFPVKQLAIVGSGLRTVERVTGKLTWGKAAGAGAASGAWIGLFFGLVLFLFSPQPTFASLAAAILIGIAFGMIFGITSYAITRRRRDFTSTNQVLASHYEVIIDPALTARAQDALARSATSD